MMCKIFAAFAAIAPMRAEDCVYTTLFCGGSNRIYLGVSIGFEVIDRDYWRDAKFFDVGDVA